LPCRRGEQTDAETQMRRLHVAKGRGRQVGNLLLDAPGVGRDARTLLVRNADGVEVPVHAHDRSGVRVRGIEQDLPALQSGPLHDPPGHRLRHVAAEEQQIGRDEHGPRPLRRFNGHGLGIEVVEHAVGDARPIAAHGHGPLGRDLHPGQTDAPGGFFRPRLAAQQTEYQDRSDRPSASEFKATHG